METTKCYVGSGQVTRTVRIEDKRGRVHNIAVTVYGWKVLLVIDAVTKIPLAVKTEKIHEHEALWTRALVAQARTNLAGNARLHKVVFDKAFLAGTDVRWLNQHGLYFVVPAKENMAVTADAQAQAMAGEGISVGRRVHTVRHGQGKTAWSARLETKDYGPRGKTVFLTNAPVDKPLQPFDDDDDRSLIENCCIKAAKQQWDLGQPPQKNERAVRVHVLCTLLMFALATAYRPQCDHEARGGEPIGWLRWRRQQLEQTRDQVIVFAQGCYGIFHMAEYSLLLGAKLKDIPPGIGSRQDVLAKHRLIKRG